MRFRKAMFLLALIQTICIGGTQAAAQDTVVFSAESPCRVSVNADEPGRAGSSSAYWIQGCKSGDVRLAEALVFTKESIRRFDEACKKATGQIDDDGCWASIWRPHSSDIDAEQAALGGGQLPDGYQRVVLNGRKFLVHEMVVSSSGLTLREYASYDAGRRLTLWAYIQPDVSTDVRSVTATQREVSDRLAAQVKVTVNATQ